MDPDPAEVWDLSIQERRPGMVPARLILLKNEVLFYFPGPGRVEARSQFGVGSELCNEVCGKLISTIGRRQRQ
jgi:hypothetical protein